MLLGVVGALGWGVAAAEAAVAAPEAGCAEWDATRGLLGRVCWGARLSVAGAGNDVSGLGPACCCLLVVLLGASNGCNGWPVLVCLHGCLHFAAAEAAEINRIVIWSQ